MDRLSIVIAAAFAASACDDGGGGEGQNEPRERVNVVASKAGDGPSLEGFCDVYHADPGEAPAFSMPELTGPAPSIAQGWHWINLWATWCKPCVEEIPRMREFTDRLRGAGADVALQLVSVDDSDEVIAEYRKEHPETPGSVRVADPDAIGGWIEGFGLDSFASVPIHVFVDPGGRARCVRLAGVADSDYPAIEHLLTGGG